MRKQFDIHRHTGGLEINHSFCIIYHVIHRHTGGLENKLLAI